MSSGGDWKALYRAAQDGDLNLVARWLDEGVDPNYQHPEFGTTPLIAATEQGQFEAVKLLVDRGARPDVASEWERTTAEQVADDLGRKAIAAWLREQRAAPPG